MRVSLHAALVLGALAAACSRPGDAPLPVAPAAGSATAVLQLGQVICGDCCVERVEKALDGTPGVGGLDMSPGQLDFEVTYDPSKVSPEQLAEKLVAAGEKGARVSPDNERVAPKKQWVRARPR